LPHQRVRLAQITSYVGISWIELKRFRELRQADVPFAEATMDIAGIFDRQGVIRLEL